MMLKIRGKTPFNVDVKSIEDAQAFWIEYREKTGCGASEIGDGARIVDARGKTIAHVSYNGRVWAGARYVPGAEPILEVPTRGGNDHGDR